MNFDALVVGLGNPGPKYAFTRHNIGFILLDLIAGEQNQKFSSSGLAKAIQAEMAEVSLVGKKLLLMKPQTFMNLSGESLQRLYQKQQHLRELPLIVAHDEVDLPFRKLRFKAGGSDAGHNGLKSLRACLGHGDYYRLRLGVGRPAPDSPLSVADYVLGHFTPEEKPELLPFLDQGAATLESFLEKGLAAAQGLASLEKYSRSK